MSEHIEAAGTEDTTEATEAADTAADTDTDTDTEAADTEAEGDVFPRAVVEKLRREAAGHRERATAAEQNLSALQRQTVAAQITAAGMKPEAVFAVAELGDLLADDGTVDSDKLQAAMASARSTLGIAKHTRRAPFGGQGELLSGAARPQQRQDGWKAAFGPRPR